MNPQEADSDARHGFAVRLQAALDRRGYSHREVAQAIGASKQSVTNWTQGRNEPSLRHLRNIAALLEVPIASLLEPDDSPEQREDEAAELIRELAAEAVAPAVRTLSERAPSLLDLLTRAERYVERTDTDPRQGPRS